MLDGVGRRSGCNEHLLCSYCKSKHESSALIRRKLLVYLTVYSVVFSFTGLSVHSFLLS